MRRQTRAGFLVMIGLLAGSLAGVTSVLPGRPAGALVGENGGETWRITRAGTGAGIDPNDYTSRARISQDGKHACYQSWARNLVPDDPMLRDVFWSDFTNPAAPVTRRVSVAPDGGPANGESTFCEISGDGRYVVFFSEATNLVQGSAAAGAFVRDMQAANPATATRLIQGNSSRPVISDDGRWIAYNTNLPDSDIFAMDRITGAKVQITNGSGTSDEESFRPEISGDGSHVIFASDLPLDPAKDQAVQPGSPRDVYMVDISAWRTNPANPIGPYLLVSVGTNGMAAGRSSSRPGINHDGKVVSFQSESSGLVPNDSNNQPDAFVRDYRTVAAGETTLISYRRDGVLPNAVGSRPQLDDSGDVVAFVSTASQIVGGTQGGDDNNREDAFVRVWKAEKGKDLTNPDNRRTYMLAAGPNGEAGTCPGSPETDEGHSSISTRPYLSGDGLTAVWVTGACNLVTDAAHGGPDGQFFSDIYVRRYPTLDPPYTEPPPPPPPPPVQLKSFGHFFPVANPTRILDTRSGIGRPAGKIGGGAAVAIPVRGRGGVPADAELVAMNVTVTNPTVPSFLTVYPSLTPLPEVSNLNFAAGQTAPNQAVVKIGADGNVNVFLDAGQADVLFDVVGWFGSKTTTAQGSRLTSVAPVRKLDTRVPAMSQGHPAPLAAGETIDIQVADPGVKGVVLNLTGIDPTATTFVTAYPADAPVRPNASNLNLVPGQNRPNLVMVGVSPQGRIKLFNEMGSTHLAVDVVGTFSLAPVNDNVPLGRVAALPSPERVVDTRKAGGALSGPGSRTNALPAFGSPDVPGAPVTGVVMNVTATQATQPTYLTVFPGGTPPLASNLNVLPGRDIPNLVLVGLSSGSVSIFNEAGAVHYLYDVSAVLLG